MKLAEDLWLRGQAARTSMMHLIAYNTAFAGTATVQAWKLGLTAPAGFWSAIGRAGGAANLSPAEPAPPAEAVAPVEAYLEPIVEVPVEPVADITADLAETEPGQNPHLLDAPRGGQADDLTILSGIGAKLAQSLNEFGIYHFDQLATLDADGIEWLNEQQKGFRMICARHKIVEQAQAIGG